MPFGLGQVKPKHFRDMARVAWVNRDNLGYAWQVLSRGVCDGCALGVAGFHDWTLEGVHLCMTRLNLLRLNTMPAMPATRLADVGALASWDNARLRELGRLPCPMVREKAAPGFRPITWAEALTRLGQRLRGIDPRRLAFFLTSRGLTNEVYYVAQKLARCLGTNHVDNAARLCHAPSTAAMKRSLGVAATTCSYRDWYGADLVVFFGANPANDQPVTTKYLHEAKRLGTRVVMVNPYCEPGLERYWVPSTPRSALFGSALADYWFPVGHGGDIAFVAGVLKCLIERDWVNHAFIENYTTGFAELATDLQRLDWAALEQGAGLGRASMEEFAGLMHEAETAVLVWSMGITQHTFGADAVQMLLNLGLARGYVGRERCGLMPIRGHSSVQGGAEMGAYATCLPGGRAINGENAAWLAEQYGFSIPDWVGMTTTEMVEAAARGQLDLFYCLGGNLLRTLPEPAYVHRALASVPVRVHQDILLTDQMLIPAPEEVYLLPAKTRYEQDDGGTETTTERRVIFSPELPRVVGEARAEWRILRDLAAAAYPERASRFGCESGPAIRAEIARLVPIYEGIQQLRASGDAFQYGGPHLCANGRFPTPDGKGHFYPVALPERPRAADQFEVSTRRGKQFNSLIYAEIDPLNGAGREAILMNPADARALGLRERQRIALVNDVGRFEGRVRLARIAPGNLQIHWPEGNVILRRGVVDAAGGVPDYNTQARVERC